MLVVLSLASLISLSVAFRSYGDLIPNGHQVPDPCQNGGIWAGVGHYSAKGTGDRNPFGLAFAAEGHVWTDALCQADSDRDGVSNGAELGDPHCHWSVDKNTHLGAALSHPGICEPIGSTQCSWQHFHCK